MNASWLKRRLRVLFRRDTVETDLSDEIRLHLDMETDELMRQGRTREEARREARMLLGGVEQTKEAARDVRPLRWLNGIGLDLLLGLRMLRKSWGLTLVGGLAMVVVIGLCTTGFVLLQAVRSAELPLEDGDQVVALRARDQRTREVLTSVEHLARWRESLRSVEDLSAVQTIERDLTTENGLTVRVSTARMTASGFRVARVRPLLGRTLTADDERTGAERVVVLEYDLWQSRFAGDPAVLGGRIRLGGLDYVVVGVMPEGFRFPVNHRAWIALPGGPLQGPEARVRVFGRLAEGVPIETARAELAAVGAVPVDGSNELPAEPLATNVVPFGVPFSDPQPDVWMFRAVPLLFALLLIPPCANIAILIYARNVTRAEEFAARYVLGASRGRIVGQLMVEVWVLAACAGGVGLAVAQWFLDWARQYGEQDVDFSRGIFYWMWDRFQLSFEAVIYVAGLVLFAGMVAGGVPALRATGRMARAGFQGLGARTGGPRLGRTWAGMVAVQVTIAMAALPPAAQQIGSSLATVLEGPGFAAEEYLTARLALDDGGSAARFGDLQAEFARLVRAEPGVFGATLSSETPEVEPVTAARTDRADQEAFLTTSNAVDGAYFGVFGAAMLAGRGFEAGDFGAERRAVLVSRAFAERIGGNPLGVRVREAGENDAPWFEVVGVVANVSSNKGLPTMYYALGRGEQNAVNLALHVGRGAPAGLVERLHRIATSLDPSLRIDQLRPLDAVYRGAHRDENTVTLALAIAVGIVLLFSAAGIYTLAAFAVAQRRREIAIRAAIGARPRRLVMDIVGRTLIPVAVGAGVGALLAVYIDSGIENDFSATTLCVSAAFMVAIGLLAVAGPARRALRVDATEALRES